MYASDPSYKTDKARLMRDPEQLALLIAKLKKYKGIIRKRMTITLKRYYSSNRIDISTEKEQTSGESSSEDDAAASIRRKQQKHSHHRLREKRRKKKPRTRKHVRVDSSDSSDGNMH